MKNISEHDVLRAIESALELPSGSVGLDAEAEDVEGWDSLGHLGILSSLDVLFEGKVADLTTIASATSVPKILAVLRQHSLIK